MGGWSIINWQLSVIGWICGRGLGRLSLDVADYHIAIPARPPSFPPAPRHSRPPPVIPAKAGIHAPAPSPSRGVQGFWIPACAGMTVGAAALPEVGGRERFSLTQPSPAGRGLLVACAIPRSVTIIPSISHRHSIRPQPSFRRRSKSRTPAYPTVSMVRGVDSRFRGNDGMGRRRSIITAPQCRPIRNS